MMEVLKELSGKLLVTEEYDKCLQTKRKEIRVSEKPLPTIPTGKAQYFLYVSMESPTICL